MLPKNTAIISAFFMEGLHDAGYDLAIERWGNGAFELVQELVGYAAFAEHLVSAISVAGKFDFPGVYDYEVSSLFGKWFGLHIIEHGQAPHQTEAEGWLVQATRDFFLQGESTDRGRIEAVIAAACGDYDSSAEFPGNTARSNDAGRIVVFADHGMTRAVAVQGFSEAIAPECVVVDYDNRQDSEEAFERELLGTTRDEFDRSAIYIW